MLSLPRPLRALVAAGLLLALALPLAGGPRASAAAPVPEKTPPPGLTAQDWTQLQAQLADAGQDGRLEAADPTTFDFFGWSIAVSGELVVVGAPFDDDVGTSAGAAYLFARNQGGPGNWGLVKQLTAGDPQLGDRFGHSVAISGDIVVVGGWFEDGGPGDPRSDAGAVYVFERNHGGPDNWGQRKKLTASDAQIEDHFGQAVAVSGDLVVVGAVDEDGGPGDPKLNAGAAYVFARHQGGANNWGQVQKLTANDALADDWFGYSVAIDGFVLVVGAVGEFNQTGAAYVFERSAGGSTWNQVYKLVDFNGVAQDGFGWSVGLSGDTVVVGAWGESQSGTDAGAAFIFARNAGGLNQWGLVQELHASDAQAGDQFGYAVGISGDVAVVGAVEEDGGAGNPVSSAGAVYIFERNHGGADNWGESGVFRDAGAGVDDFLGVSVAVGGSGLIAAGATGADAIVPDPNVAPAGAAFLACQDDALEDNDFANTASALPEGRLSGLQICGGDQDIFTFVASAGDWLSLVLDFAHTDGDLDVYLFQSGDLLNSVAGGVSVDDDEVILYPVTADDTYYVQVVGYADAINRYSLSLTTAPLFIPVVRR